MVKVQGSSSHLKNARTFTLPMTCLVAALHWDAGDKEDCASSGRHPLLVLQDLLREHSTEEESMESLRKKLSYLINLLQVGQEVKNQELGEMNLPTAAPLAIQFAQRPLLSDSFVDEDRLCSSYWLTTQWVDEADTELDKIRCDILETAKMYVPQLDLVAETEKLCKSHMSNVGLKTT